MMASVPKAPLRGPRIPLSIAKADEALEVVKVSGGSALSRHLAGLGFVPGARVRLQGHSQSGVIVEVRGVSVALDDATARKVMAVPQS